MASKKKQEEIAKQIDIKKEFADKVYKKMRSDRYGLTFCCPNDLQNINVKNYMCNWQDIGYETMPEEYTKNYTTNPIANYCLPPGIYNPVTGLCDAEASQTLVGVTEFTLSDALPNGTQVAATASNDPAYGPDCPIIFDSANQNGTGTNPIQMNIGVLNSPISWWKYHDGTPGGDEYNPNNPNVTNISYANALGKAPTTGWPSSETYEFAFNVNLDATTTLWVALCADHKFGFKSITGGVTTTHIDVNTMSSSQLVNMLGQAVGNIWGPENNGNWTIQGLIDQNERANECNATTISSYNWSLQDRRVPANRWWIYPLELAAGCHTVSIQGYNKDYDGMLAAAVFNNTKNEVMTAGSESELNVVFSTANQDYMYSDIDASNPWTCQAPGLPISTTPYSVDCPGCRTQTSTMVLQCPDGYSYNETADICEATFTTCDTETLMFEVVNQNGEVMPNYEIIFDGGNYTTNDEGEVSIVIEDASVNTDHMLNLCHCITTGGGCAVQKIKIVVTDPNIETCTPVDEICPCKAPALINTEIAEGPFISPVTVTLTFQDLNLSNSSNTIESYIFEWKLTTDTEWNILPVTKPSGVTTFNINLELSGGDYEYRIKTICTTTESNYAGIYQINIPDTYGEDLIFWAETNDKTSVFTDLAGTTNVANDGDPVRRINNKSTSTKKLGNFIRSVETLGWDNVAAVPPKWMGTGANGNGYVDIDDSGTQPEGTGLPLVSNLTAGFGGVNDGVSFSNLTDLDVNNSTVISVFSVSEALLDNAFIPITFLWRVLGARVGAANMGYYSEFFRNSTGTPIWRQTGTISQIFSNISDPYIEANDAQIGVIRSTSESDNNIYGRNEWDVNNTDPEVSYNQVINFPVSPDVINFSGGAIGSELPGVNIGGWVNTTGGNENISSMYTGRFYELMVFKKKLTDTELNTLVSFLKTKYGIL